MTAQTLTARRRAEQFSPRPALRALLVSVLVTGSACLVAVLTAPEAVRVPLAWGAGAAAVLLCAAAVALALQQERNRLLRSRIADMEHDSAWLAEDTVPALVRLLRDGASPESALAAAPVPAAESHRQVLRTFAEELGRSEGGRAAALSACASAAGRMQALATGMLADLREMEHRHSDEAVLGDLLHLDHRTAQSGRLADSVAVLTGARSGRRWAKPIVMESILRGAMGRIAAYQRVRTHSTNGLAVAGHAAEGVMHALAEILDNAANFSPPTAEVHVYVEEVPSGVVITVEDSGLVMSDFALRRAERAVSGEPLDLATLSGTRLGLAVVGCLARKHGLTVSFRPSARGGTGVLVRIPQELITQPRPAGDVPRRGAGTAVAGASGPAAPAPDAADAPSGGTRRGAALPRALAGRGAPSDKNPDNGTPRNGTARGDAAAAAAAPGVPGGDPGATAAGTPGPEGTRAARLPRRDRPGDEEAAHGRGNAGGTESPAEFGESGLPRRRRGRTLAAARAAERRPGASSAAPRVRSAAESAARFGVFRRALQGKGEDTGSFPLPAPVAATESPAGIPSDGPEPPPAEVPDTAPADGGVSAARSGPPAPAAEHPAERPAADHASEMSAEPAAPTGPATSQPEDDTR